MRNTQKVFGKNGQTNFVINTAKDKSTALCFLFVTEVLQLTLKIELKMMILEQKI